LRIDDELRVTAALAELPADYQEVIVLRNLQRLPFNEVAERMERSRPAVQMLWMRAIKKLQEALGQEEL
jgi:RNA polymerase sigma-70 factor, ECF subfamily